MVTDSFNNFTAALIDVNLHLIVLLVMLLKLIFFLLQEINVTVQVSDLENGSWESDHTFVVELDGARKETQCDNMSTCVR